MGDRLSVLRTWAGRHRRSLLPFPGSMPSSKPPQARGTRSRSNPAARSHPTSSAASTSGVRTCRTSRSNPGWSTAATPGSTVTEPRSFRGGHWTAFSLPLRVATESGAGRRTSSDPAASVAPLGLVIRGNAGPTADAVGYRLSVLRTCDRSHRRCQRLFQILFRSRIRPASTPMRVGS